MLRTTRRLAAATCALALVGASAGPAALAGEVKGPPGEVGVFGSGSEEDTQAPTHAKSICAFSGLNDFREGFGEIETRTQTPGQEHRLGNTPPGVPGTACNGHLNPLK
jgi:hypothetical protein